ncbi:hypothetical protein HZS_8002, partial [Henneguya salminicola]
YSSHLNIARFYGAFMIGQKYKENSKKYLWVAMELCSFSTNPRELLQKIGGRRNKLKESWCVYFLKGILTGLEYLHDKGIIHRDIKSDNVMVNRDGVVKLVDFGVSTIITPLKPKADQMIGTPYWMAPEVILLHEKDTISYDTKCDIWSVGITAIEYSDGQAPRLSIEPTHVLKLIPISRPPKLKNFYLRSYYYNRFVNGCLKFRPEDRPTATTLLN